MKCAIARSCIGMFAFSGSGELIFYRLFDKDPIKAANEFLEEGKDFLSQLKDYEVIADDKIMRKLMREYAISLGFAESSEELNSFLSGFASALSQKRMASAASRDRLVIQASNALDELKKISNLLSERLHEWYVIHYPEAKPAPCEIARYGSRENFPGFASSVGAELTKEDEEALKSYAMLAANAEHAKKMLEGYVRNAMREIASNISSLIEPLLAARLLALAGSLEKLAKMSASTIQLLGAEKALFRHLRKQGRSPKFGLLFMDSRIQSAKDKGKVARLIAAKLAVAARIDFFTGRLEPKLKRELDEDISKIG